MFDTATSSKAYGNRLLAKAGLAYRKYHATRHTYATWLLSDGADLRWVQQQMGHASIGQTATHMGMSSLIAPAQHRDMRCRETT
jgi:site-specific recombinase XerD